MMRLMEALCNAYKVVVLGSTGLIGQEVTKLLLDSPEIAQVIAPGRRAANIDHKKLNKIVLEMDRLDEKADIFEGASAVFCCLGTTMRQAKSRAAFMQVDFDYPLLAAKAAHARGVKHFILVSAQGASNRSPFFYSRVKGKLEQVLRQIPFERLTIARPGLLLGRKTGERPLEDMAGWLMRGLTPLWRGPLEKFAAIRAKDVARQMLASFFQTAQDKPQQGLEILEFKR